MKMDDPRLNELDAESAEEMPSRMFAIEDKADSDTDQLIEDDRLNN